MGLYSKLFFIFLGVQQFSIGNSQQRCSYVTVPVCDDDVTISPGQLGASRGQKGDVGPPGKMGPSGPKGQKGEPLAFAEFQAEIRSRLEALESRFCVPQKCSDSLVNGHQTLCNGEEAFCENGWTVFQRRYDGSVNFQLNWANFSNGFGNLSGEFWLGLNKVYRITKGDTCRLLIDLWDFDDNYAYAEYGSFRIGPEPDNYTVSMDRDNDVATDHCVFRHDSGSFWFKNCFRVSTNAPWGRSTKAWDKIVWFGWKGSSDALKATAMKFRCD